MPDPGEDNFSGNDAEQLGRLMDLELAGKRADWKKAATRRQKLRMVSFFFLFLLIIGSVFALFLLLSRVNEERANLRSQPSAAVRGP